MSLFGSSINPAPIANGGFTSRPSATSGSGAPVTDGFGFASASSVRFDPAFSASNVVRSAVWAENASEPFGRVESTARCFARNGKVATTSKWTPPKPPSRPLFQIPPGFHSSSNDATSLFGPSDPRNEATVNNGGFLFGCAVPTTKSGMAFGTVSAVSTGFGGAVGQSKATPMFGNTANVSGSTVGPDFGTKPVFGNASSPLEASSEDSGIGGARTVFGLGSSTAKPPLAPPSNTFAVSTKQVGISYSNSFAPKSASTSNPFTFTSQRWTGNPLATKVSANESVNPFVTNMFVNTTVNPFATNGAANESVNPFAVRGSSNVRVEPVPDASMKPSSVSGPAASTKFKRGLRPVFNAVQQQQPPLVQSVSVASFDWTGWRKENEAIQTNVETSFKMPSFVPSEAKSSSLDDSSSPSDKSSAPDALIASPDTDPYGSGSFGAGLVEQKIKTAIANPPSSVELKVFDTLSCSKPHQQPSAKFAARLGLARQPLQSLPMRSVQPRFLGRRVHPSSTGEKLQHADVFRFSSSFSRLAISKNPLRIRVKPSPMLMTNATAENTTKSESDDDVSNAPTEVTKPSAGPDDEDICKSPSSACPVLLNKEYFTEPSVSELQQLTDKELCCVGNFVIGRRDCGKITFIDAVDVRGLQLDELVAFSMGEIVVYPDDNVKPAIGSELNKPAIVELHGIYAGEKESHEHFLKRLEKHTQKMGATFLGYDNGGVWSFRVEHF
ncbi:hypothetical protein PPTG_07799 [Phytophthora nicotianae INRA-310]|uniref:Peptidase S59 domain-containing protein n=1 Tax=Phytophthora nicotianae (strain INRA-310) TaxID=761204 RepID=W2QPF4_PHYN3|nr:hypothetical protein PPTG_07799 [Phytophthora nicotianae INRA-310]ETN14140.1 hypothetical protein PPTG_07799 [Phytophthora nicotianae INRA-310]